MVRELKGVRKTECDMLLKIYSIRDTKGEIYNTPFYQRTHGEAERNFKTVASDSKSTISQFPEDYDLYYLGEYDDQTGKIKSLDKPQHITKAINVIDKRPDYKYEEMRNASDVKSAQFRPLE